jgi:redox-sensitive bicupin YhaK (pirin superfamily)
LIIQKTQINSQKLVLVVSKEAREGSIAIEQDADMYISRLKSGDDLDFNVRNSRGVWIQVIKGSLQIAEKNIKSGDALSTQEPQSLKVLAHEDSEIIIFDIG